MTLHFVRLALGNKTYKAKVSTEGCSDVDDFKAAIKNMLSPYLDAFTTVQLTLLQPNGTTEIDPGETKLNEFNVGPWTPLVVTVDELPTPALTGSSKKQLVYKGMTTEASCRKYLNALAIAFFIEYEFPKNYGKPTMGDVLAAFRGKQVKREQTILGGTTGRMMDSRSLTNLFLLVLLLINGKHWKNSIGKPQTELTMPYCH
jgi:hypothetical protein